MSFFKEASCFINFFFKIPKHKKNIVFYAEHGGYYPYLEGAITQLTEQHKAHVCYVTSDKNDPIFNTRNNLITPFYFKKLLPWFMMLVNSNVFVMTLTDLHQFHLRRSINPVKYIYMFHALVSTNMMYREGAFDHYDTIICCGPHHIKEIRKREKQLGLKEKKLFNGGYHRLDQIHKQYNAKNYSNEHKKILIAPSWGEHNIVKTCGKELIKNILQNTNYYVTLRPHPEIKKHMPELLQEYVSLFGENKRFTLETSISTNQSMLQADLLITDLSGIALEYAFGTERPVIFIDLPYKIKNKNYKKLEIKPFELTIRQDIGKVISPDNIDTISEEIFTLLQNQETYKIKIRELRDKHIYEFGNSDKIAAKIISENQ